MLFTFNQPPFVLHFTSQCVHGIAIHTSPSTHRHTYMHDSNNLPCLWPTCCTRYRLSNTQSGKSGFPECSSAAGTNAGCRADESSSFPLLPPTVFCSPIAAVGNARATRLKKCCYFFCCLFFLLLKICRESLFEAGAIFDTIVLIRVRPYSPAGGHKIAGMCWTSAYRAMHLWTTHGGWGAGSKASGFVCLPTSTMLQIRSRASAAGSLGRRHYSRIKRQRLHGSPGPGSLEAQGAQDGELRDNSTLCGNCAKVLQNPLACA